MSLDSKEAAAGAVRVVAVFRVVLFVGLNLKHHHEWLVLHLIREADLVSLLAPRNSRFETIASYRYLLALVYTVLAFLFPNDRL